jgi:CheY-like chemotaxis protein
LHSVVQRAIEASQPSCDELGHTLAIDVAEGEIWVDADATRLEQVLVNLLSNACKFTHPPGHISLSVAKAENEAVIRVRDSGIGIAPELLTRVFDLFAQADRSLDRSRGGLGIGLTVAQRIVAMHDGRIDAYSEGVGKGAEFVIRLPTIDSQRASAGTGATERTRRSICRVLLIEDNADAADSMRLLLEVLGHQVRVTANGEDALEAARTLPPQLMLVDIGLPGIDGYEVARRVRRDPSLREVTLVALTGYGREEDKSAALAAGFDDHLVKPVEIEKLEAVVQRACAEK